MQGVTFPKSSSFRQALADQVGRYFDERQLSRRDQPRMYVKVAAMFAWTAASYVFLVYAAGQAWTAIGGGLSLALALVGVGFNVQHDGNHGAISRHRWINRVAGWSLDLMGASSYFWRAKHNVLHHTYTNIVGHDDDLNLWPFGRSDPESPRLWFHRYQHLYLWALYPLVHVRYVAVDVYRLLWRRIGTTAVASPKGWDMVEVLAGKAAFVTLAFVLPGLRHPWWIVLIGVVGISLCIGLIFSVVFQMAHLVDIVHPPGRVAGAVGHEFVVHQISTTANFATRNPVLTFLLGGLTHQREHHLFTRVCHVHYPAIETIVQRVCDEYGVVCHENRTLLEALRSHYRYLKVMGQPAPRS